MITHTLELFADYFQFYLQDEGAEDWTPQWTSEEMALGVASSSNTIYVHTARNMTVPVVVAVGEVTPKDEFERWDQVSECSIDIPSGRIVVAGCADYLPDARRIEVSPGCYRARIYHGDLEALSKDGLEGDDHYRVELWPSPFALPQRLK